MTDLFAEVFPIEPDAIPPLVAYTVDFAPAPPEVRNRIGGRLAARLRRLFDGGWFWLDGRIVTDNVALNPMEAVIAAGELKADDPAAFAALEGLDVTVSRDVSPVAQAEFVMRTALKPLSDSMQAALDGFNTSMKRATAQRETRLQAWDVAGVPAVSVSIASRLIFDGTLADYIGGESDMSAVKERVVGLWATDGTLRGEIVAVVGTLREHRDRLSFEAPHIDLSAAHDAGWVVTLKAGSLESEYLARDLRLIVRLPQLSRFPVDARAALTTLQMPPKTRALQVRAVSDVGKNAGILGKAYDSRIMPEAFINADFEMNLRFKDNRVRPYNPATLTDDFLKCGVYRLRDDFDDKPVRVCVVNALPMRIEDFVEAMRRQLDRSFPFEIEVIRERRVRVVSRGNLESAVRVVEKEDPDIILAFFPDEADAGDDEDSADDATAAYVKSLTLGRGLPTHVIYESTLNDPDAMTGIILSILGKTGSTPYALTEPVEAADYVVGLDITLQHVVSTNTYRQTLIARIYRADGEFLRYVVREAVSVGEYRPPFVLMRDVFPQKLFSGKRVIVHHLEALPDDLLLALRTWGQAIGTAFYPVAVIRFGAPRLYAIGDKGITQPPWGSAFKLNAESALLISSLPETDITPQPLHIRTLNPALSIDEACRSVLVWTLLTYGAERPPKLPVTAVNADQLAGWVQRGNRFNLDDGVVPFWL